MSHSATCELDGHVDDEPGSPSRQPQATEPPALPSRSEQDAAASSLKRLGAFIALREVRWAGLSTLLFLFGLALRGLGVPVAGQDAVSDLRK